MTDKILIDRTTLHDLQSSLNRLSNSNQVTDEDLRLIDIIRAALDQPVQDKLLDCEIQLRPLNYTLRDYHVAMTDGPLHFTWTDKPHRLVYDLIAAVKYYAQQPAVPPGYKLMKRDPSEEMIYAARLEGSVNTDDEIADDYRAMWDAAPEAPVQSDHIGGITGSNG